MSNQALLLNIPIIEPNEAASTFFDHVKEINSFSGRGTIFQLLGLRPPIDVNMVRPHESILISKVLGLPEGAIHGMTIHRFAAKILHPSSCEAYEGLLSFDDKHRHPQYMSRTRLHYRDRKQGLVCKDCLSEKQYERIHWRLSYVPACLEHKKQLSDLAEDFFAQPAALTDEECEAIGLFYYFLGIQDELPTNAMWNWQEKQLLATKPHQFFLLANILANMANLEKCLSENTFAINKNDPQYLVKNILLTYRTISLFPSKLDDLLECYVEALWEKERIPSVMKVLGTPLQLLESIFHGFDDQPTIASGLISHIRNFIEERYYAGVSTKVVSGEVIPVETQERVTASILGLNKPEYQSLRLDFLAETFQTEDLDFLSKEAGQRNTGEMVDWQIAMYYQNKRQGSEYTLRQYAQILGISQHYATALIKDSLLHSSLPGWRRNKIFSQLFFLKEFGVFGIFPNYRIPYGISFISMDKADSPSHSYVGINLALELVKGDISLLFCAVAEGLIEKIKVREEADQVESYYFSAHDLRELSKHFQPFYKEKLSEKHVYPFSLARYERISHYFSLPTPAIWRHWIEKGHLKPIEATKLGPPAGEFFDFIAAFELQQRIFTITDAAWLVGVGEDQLMDVLIEYGYPVNYTVSPKNLDEFGINLNDVLDLYSRNLLSYFQIQLLCDRWLIPHPVLNQLILENVLIPQEIAQDQNYQALWFYAGELKRVFFDLLLCFERRFDWPFFMRKELLEKYNLSQYCEWIVFRGR